MSWDDFANLFSYKSSLTYTLKVGNRLAVQTDELQNKVLHPIELQGFIDQVVSEHADFKVRVYIRPSGTEDLLRVHLETAEEHQIPKVKGLIDEFILGNATINP